MGVAVPAVGIEITARLDKLREEMAKIPDIGGKEAKALAAQFSREIKAMEKAAKSAAAESRAAGSAIKGVGDASGKAGQSASKLAGALDLIAPGAGSAARAVADLADVGEVAAMGAEGLGVSLGATALAAAGVAAVLGGALLIAYKVSTEEADRAAAIGRDVAAAHAALEPIVRATAAAELDLQVATGQLTEAEAELLRIRGDAHASFLQATADTKKRVAELHVEQASLTTQMVDLGARFVEAVDYIGVATTVYDGLTTSSEEVQEAIDAEMGTLQAASAATKENVKATSEASAAKRRHADAERAAAAATKAAEDATRAQTEALRESQAAMADDSARAASVASALNSMASAQTAATTAGLEGADRLVAARDAELAQLEATYQAGVAAADSDAQRTALASQYASARVAIEEDAQRQMQAAIAQTAAAEQAARKAAVQSYANSFGQISDAAAAFGDLMTEEQRDAAMRLYRISKAAAITEATLNAVLAVSEASTIPYPANLLAMAAAGAMGAANVATIAATPPPSFHTGTGAVGDGARVDEINARLQYREAVASRQGADILGRDNIDRANSGRVPRYGGDAPAVIRYRHKEYNEFIRDNIRQGGPLRDALTAGSTVGHRTNRG